MSLSSRVDLRGHAFVCCADHSDGGASVFAPVGSRAADCERATLGFSPEAFLPREARAAGLGAAGPGASAHGCEGLVGGGSTAF